MHLPDLDPLIHQPVRLRLLAALVRNRDASFVALRDGLGLTDGNLATHATKLEEAGLIRSGRVLADAKFQLRYRITREGVAAFRAYAEALGEVLAAAGPDAADGSGHPLKREAGPSGSHER